MEKVIRFYGRSHPFFEGSNFYPAPYSMVDGRVAKTSEHGFQAEKFLLTEEINVGKPNEPERWIKLKDYILQQSTPKAAADEGRRRDFPLRKDWEDIITEHADKGIQHKLDSIVRVKDLAMFEQLMLKFKHNAHCRRVLLATKDIHLIEASPIDYYWGEGRSRNGLNRLGLLLEVVRERLK